MRFPSFLIAALCLVACTVQSAEGAVLADPAAAAAPIDPRIPRPMPGPGSTFRPESRPDAAANGPDRRYPLAKFVRRTLARVIPGLAVDR